MSPVCTIAVTIVALVLPFADLCEPWSFVSDLPGITRPHAHQVAVAEVEVESNAGDVDEHPHDRGWQAGGAALSVDAESARCWLLHVPSGSDVRAGCPTAAIIRGPPART